jgi:hypothetical protein
MAAPGVMRSAWSGGAVWAGSIQLVFFAFGVVQALLLMGKLSEQFGAEGSTRKKALAHALQDGLWWGLTWLLVSVLLIALGWVGSRRVREGDVRAGSLHVASCAVVLFVAAQALVYAVNAAIARGG